MKIRFFIKIPFFIGAAASAGGPLNSRKHTAKTMYFQNIYKRLKKTEKQTKQIEK